MCRSLTNLWLLLSAPALLAAACPGDESAVSGADLMYDAFVGTWTATSFVVSTAAAPGATADLTLASALRGTPFQVTLRFDGDRKGTLEFAHTIEGERRTERADTFSVVEVTDKTLTLRLSEQGVDEMVIVEYFRSRRDDSLTLRFTYELDLTGAGEPSPFRVIAIFERAP